MVAARASTVVLRLSSPKQSKIKMSPGRKREVFETVAFCLHATLKMIGGADCFSISLSKVLTDWI